MKSTQLTISLFLTIFFISCNQAPPMPEVQTISAMKKVMMGEDLSMNLNWDTLPKSNLFAVAPLGRIQGEVTVINGDIFTSVVDASNQILINQDWNIRSPFAVYANVEEWQSFEFSEIIKNENDLQDFVEKIAKANGYDIKQPFPFRIIGEFSVVDYHIISKPIDEEEHNHNLHKKAKKHFRLENVEGELLGFYSQNHEGVFTHKGHFIHTHFIDNARENMGHLEDVVISNQFKILLPKY